MSTREEMDRLAGELTRLIAADPECERFDDREKLWMKREELRAKLAEETGRVPADTLFAGLLIAIAYVCALSIHRTVGSTIMLVAMVIAVLVHRRIVGGSLWRSS